MHVLVVEDEPAIADFLQRGLTAEGYSVTAAADGNDAAQLARSGEADLMILDLMLPGRDGADVLAEVREARPQLPVIVLTARTEIDSKVAMLQYQQQGADSKWKGIVGFGMQLLLALLTSYVIYKLGIQGD